MPKTGPSTKSRPSVSWADAILVGLRAPVNANNRQKLWNFTWQELGDYSSTGGWDFDANLPRWNWFDSTLPVPGSTNCGSCSQQSVQRYPNPAAGVMATVQTLLSPNYGWPAVVANLRNNGSYEDFGAALAASDAGGAGWGGYPAWNSGKINYDPSTALASPPAGGGGGGGGSTSTGGSTGGGTSSTASNSCCGHAPNPGQTGGDACNLFTIPHTSVGMSYCTAKKVAGGATMVGGGILMVIGVLVLARGTTVGKAASMVITKGAGAKAGSKVPTGGPSASEMRASPNRPGSATRLAAAKSKSEPLPDKPPPGTLHLPTPAERAAADRRKKAS